MALLVSDSSVLIELERGVLLETAFGCGLPMVVPDLLFENELREHKGLNLQEMGLTVTELNSEELQLAQDIRDERPGLSIEDCFALSCAHRPDHILLSADGLLRRTAMDKNVECRGVLWLLDQMLASGKVSALQLCEGLVRISEHPRCWQPKDEMALRIAKWCQVQSNVEASVA